MRMVHLYAALIGLIQGITEFLPISSSGHLILAQYLTDFESALGGNEAAEAFDVFLHVGTLLAVVAAYPGRFAGLLDLHRREGFFGIRGILLLVLSTLPALAAGYIASKTFERQLRQPIPVAMGFTVGAVWILAVEWLHPRVRKEGVDSLGWKEALGVGLFQCLALWPGISRSAATILGGMILGVERRTATEFSFLVAAPVIVAAAAHDLHKNYLHLSASHIPIFAIGLIVSFISGWLAVKLLVSFLGRHTLTPFAWYRLVLAAVVVWAVMVR